MKRSRGSAPAPTGLSLGAKFVGLTAGLILLLLATALISLRNSAETVGEIETVVEFAIPGYGALARGHIRSLEQAVELRRALLIAEDPAAPEDAIAERAEAFLAARRGFHRQFEDADQLLEDKHLDALSSSIVADLGRLHAELTSLHALIESYDEETDAALAAIRARALPEARRRLVTIDRLRDELGERLEAMRAGMFAVLETVSSEAQAAQARAQMSTIVVFVLSSILGLGIAAIGAARLIRAIKSIVVGAEAVEGGDLEMRIEIASRDEIGRLAASFNRMTEGLRMRERIRETFGKYVDRRIAEQLIGSGNLLAERGERREAAIMFCDLVGFTALSERVEPERLVPFLNAYFSLIARQIATTDGVIDKYIGDAVMAYWCPPFVPKDEIALRSADAVLLCLKEMPAIDAARREILDVPVYEPPIRIGIASGPCITGSIGAQERRNYTVIGDTVNLASRIEGANRVYRTTNLVCGRTAAAIAGKFALREVDTVHLPGIEGPQSLFEIIGRADEIGAEVRALKAEYELGLSAYRRGDWPSAQRHLSQCLSISPEDGATRTMLQRLGRLAAASASGPWSGVWSLGKDDLL